MTNNNHTAKKITVLSSSHDYGVFFIDGSEVGDPPRKITPYMLECAYYLQKEISSVSENDGVFASGPLDRILSYFPMAGFLMIIYGVALAFDPDRVTLHWLGWLIGSLGVVLLGGSMAGYLIGKNKKNRAYSRVLKYGRLVHASVLKLETNDEIVRELRFHKPVNREGVDQFDREWVMQTQITISVEDHEIEFITFRPEIISVFQPGSRVPILWHKDWPNLFIPVHGESNS